MVSNTEDAGELRGTREDPHPVFRGRRAKRDSQLPGAATWGLLLSEDGEESRETPEVLHTLP